MFRGAFRAEFQAALVQDCFAVYDLVGFIRVARPLMITIKVKEGFANDLQVVNFVLVGTGVTEGFRGLNSLGDRRSYTIKCVDKKAPCWKHSPTLP